MVKAKIYFDARRLDNNGEGHLRVRVSKHGKTAMFSLAITIRPSQWDNGAIINHPNADSLNSILSIKKGEIDRALIEMSALGIMVGKTAKEIATLIQERLDPDLATKRKEHEDKVIAEEKSFCLYFSKYIQKKENKGTRTLYSDTFNKIQAFLAKDGIFPSLLTFDSLTKEWLTDFERYCLTTERQNTASRHLRDIRAVLNSAIDDGLTSVYPFRRFKIKKEETFDKSFSSEELRQLFNAECYPGGQEEAIDMFKLMFCLIGINCVDLYNAGKAERGRLNYIRKKTHKPYSIRIEPEAAEIIAKYAGENTLISIKERCPNYKTYFNRMIKTLKRVGKKRVTGKMSIGEAILPDVCTGSARTSWATIAQAELDIPRDIIAAALGHHTVDVTTTYLRTDWRKKVDKANRQVLDWVLYGKKNR